MARRVLSMLWSVMLCAACFLSALDIVSLGPAHLRNMGGMRDHHEIRPCARLRTLDDDVRRAVQSGLKSHCTVPRQLCGSIHHETHMPALVLRGGGCGTGGCGSCGAGSCGTGFGTEDGLNEENGGEWSSESTEPAAAFEGPDLALAVAEKEKRITLERIREEEDHETLLRAGQNSLLEPALNVFVEFFAERWMKITLLTWWQVGPLSALILIALFSSLPVCDARDLTPCAWPADLRRARLRRERSAGSC